MATFLGLLITGCLLSDLDLPISRSSLSVLQTLNNDDQGMAANIIMNTSRSWDTGHDTQETCLVAFEASLEVTPDIRLIPDFLSNSEVEHLLSFVSLLPWKPFTHKEGDMLSMTSRTKSHVPAAGDPVVTAMITRIGRTLGLDVSLVDGLPLVRSFGGHAPIDSHIDVFSGSQRGEEVVPDASLLIYLTESGVATDFPNANTSVESIPGSLLLFRSVDDAGRPNKMTEHQARNVMPCGGALLLI